MAVKIRSLSIGMLMIACVVAVVTFFSFFSIFMKFQKVGIDANNYITLQEDIRKVEHASNYLTELSRKFVVTMDEKFAFDYFEEVNVKKNRENAVAEIKSFIQDENFAACVLLDDALMASNKLMEKEIHAMKLVSEVMNFSREQIPSEIFDYKLSKDELNLPSLEKSEMARFLLFDKSYDYDKNTIWQGLDYAMGQIVDYMNLRQMKSIDKFTFSLGMQIFCTILLILLIVVISILVKLLILKPLEIYIRCIKSELPLKTVGSVEFLYLVKTYNNIYRLNNEAKAKLKYQAEHDALTGVLNRGAFENICDLYKQSNENLVLLLVDVDKFKLINDTFGHEMGDKALRKVANVLSDHFSSQHFVVRYGGDEFAVLMTEVKDSVESRNAIESKVKIINTILGKRSDDCEAEFSASIGVAFSNDGYSDELFNKADRALYLTKQNGRCGVTFG